jgi:hypothetical protein
MRAGTRLLSAAAFVLAACASSSGPTVRVDFDKDAPFERYRTFSFQTPLGIGDGAVTRFLVSATRRELEARGLRFEEGNADLRVNLNGRLSEAQGVALSGPPGGNYSYRQGQYAAWSGYPAREAAPYTIGTIEIDLVDVSSRQLVWESVITEVVTDQVLTELQPAIDRIVAAAFARYPRGSNSTK